MVKIIDLSVKLEDFMPSHKNLQRPFVKPHVTHEDSKSRKLGKPEDPMTFTTTFMAMVDHTGTHVDAFYPQQPRRAAGGRDAARDVHRVRRWPSISATSRTSVTRT